MEVIGITKAAKRSGLTRAQIVYIEHRGYLGVVSKERDLRRFSEAQVTTLTKIASCRAVGLSLEDATAIASTGSRLTPDEMTRLYVIVARKARSIRREVEAWEYVFSLIQAARSNNDGEKAA